MNQSLLFIRRFLKALPRYFWPLFIVCGMSAGVVLMDYFRTYSSQLTILVIQKNEKTAGSADQVMNSIVRIPLMLSFYDGLLSRFPEINDPWRGEDPATRARLWQERIEVSRLDDSGLITLRVNANTASDAEALVKKSSLHLFGTIGRYYDIQTELDMRTVDASVTSVVMQHILSWILASLMIGYAIAVLVSSGLARVFTFASKWYDQKRNHARTFPSISSVEPMPFQVVSLPGLSDQKASSVQAVSSEPSTIANLPVLEEGVSIEEYLFGSTVTASETIAPKQEDVSEEIAQRSEPTPEELKRRFNQLLKGEKV